MSLQEVVRLRTRNKYVAVASSIDVEVVAIATYNSCLGRGVVHVIKSCVIFKAVIIASPVS